MTVKELIEELSQYPENAEILYDVQGLDYYTYPINVEYFCDTNEVVIRDC